MDRISIFEAKTHFSALLERVAGGETVTITRHGTPVARLVPVSPVRDKDHIRETIARIEAFAGRHSLGDLDWKALRDEGRK